MSKLNTTWITGMLLLTLATTAQGAITRPVTDNGQPTKVYVVGAILDVDKIDSEEQNFTLNFYAVFRWTDPSLAHSEKGFVIRNLYDVWNPRLTIVNAQNYWANTKDEVEISPQGVVTYRLHMFGDFSQPMELKEYPQDRHVFELPVVALGYRPNEVVLLPDPDTESFIAEKLSVADWHIGNMQAASRVITLANDNSLPGFVFSFEGRRLLHHYVVKIITPLILIVMMSWVVFWVDPKNVPNQLGVAVTTVLTLIAYHIALSSKLPEIPHLTNMDKFLFSSTMLVFMSLVEVVLTSHLASRGKLAQARRIDGLARWLFPILFIISLGISFSF